MSIDCTSEADCDPVPLTCPHPIVAKPFACDALPYRPLCRGGARRAYHPDHTVECRVLVANELERSGTKLVEWFQGQCWCKGSLHRLPPKYGNVGIRIDKQRRVIRGGSEHVVVDCRGRPAGIIWGQFPVYRFFFLNGYRKCSR